MKIYGFRGAETETREGNKSGERKRLLPKNAKKFDRVVAFTALPFLL